MDDQRANREGGGSAKHYAPRDQQRIDRMIELLREAWHLAPDWRLTQLIVNATDASDDRSGIFYLGDDGMESRLKALIAGLKQVNDSKGDDSAAKKL